MEDKENYTYKYRRDKVKERQRLMIIVLGGFAVLLIVAAVLGAVAGNKSAVKKFEKENAVTQRDTKEGETSAGEEAVTKQPAKQETKAEPIGVYEVTSDGINVRPNHSLEGDPIGKLNEGDKITVYEIYEDKTEGTTNPEWARFEYNGRTAWVTMKFLRKTADPVSPDMPKDATGNYKTTSSVRLREGHSTSDNSLTTIDPGTVLVITEIYEDPNAKDANVRTWGKTEYNGKTGWVSMYYLTPSN